MSEDQKSNTILPIIDAHSHVQFPVYDEDRPAVLQRAKDLNIKMVAVGTQASTSEAAIILAHQDPENIWATVGFHPGHASGKWYHDKNEQAKAMPEKFDIERLRELAVDPKVIAIGECGLDYYRLSPEGGAENSPSDVEAIKTIQKEIFIEQAYLAQELGKPLMIHCRPSKGTDDAYIDLFNILREIKFSQGVIMHFYVGSMEMTKKFLSIGAYFTFGGVITFARDYDEVIKFIPVDRILLETDCPYVAPKSQRGKRNEPSFISETADTISFLKNIELSYLLEKIHSNTKMAMKI